MSRCIVCGGEVGVTCRNDLEKPGNPAIPGQLVCGAPGCQQRGPSAPERNAAEGLAWL